MTLFQGIVGAAVKLGRAHAWRVASWTASRWHRGVWPIYALIGTLSADVGFISVVYRHKGTT